MKAAIVTGAGQTPIYGDFEEPVPGPGENRIAVAAAAVSPLVKARASGAHYSSSGQFPFVVGIDGVGRLDDGKRVYFLMPRAPHGSMAEQTVAPASHCLPIPDDLDDVTAAAIANPGMSSWAAFRERAKLQPGETVLINGATGTAGRLAVQIARHLGAKKVIGTGRNAESLRSLAALGADETISLVENEAALWESFEEPFAKGVHVIIDYLWGKSAASIVGAGARLGGKAAPARFVQVGEVAGSHLTMPGSVLRSWPVELMGSGLGSVPLDRLVHCIGELLQATVPGGFQIANTPVPLSDFEVAWRKDESSRRTVFTMNAGKL